MVSQKIQRSNRKKQRRSVKLRIKQMGGGKTYLEWSGQLIKKPRSGHGRSKEYKFELDNEFNFKWGSEKFKVGSHQFDQKSNTLTIIDSVNPSNILELTGDNIKSLHETLNRMFEQFESKRRSEQERALEKMSNEEVKDEKQVENARSRLDAFMRLPEDDKAILMEEEDDQSGGLKNNKNHYRKICKKCKSKKNKKWKTRSKRKYRSRRKQTKM